MKPMNKTAFIEFEFNVPYLEFAYEKVDKVIKQYNNEGYKVVSITPITGSEKADDIYPGNHYYITFTRGVILVFEKVSL
jgi:hypothetical protein